MRINLQALLPAEDGSGWYVAVPQQTRLCSAMGCMRLAVAYHRANYDGVERDKYRCREHLDENMEIRNGRVWINNEPFGS